MKRSTILLTLILLLAALLRFYHIDQIPHGLYIDEVSIGYNAYTILHTGKDEYATPFPIFFKAFGEYKLPLYIYITSLSMIPFGKTELAVRFPSALAGTLTVLTIYFLVKELFPYHVIPASPESPRAESDNFENKSRLSSHNSPSNKNSSKRSWTSQDDKRINHLLEIRNLPVPEWVKLDIPIIATALLAISPWHIQFSRAGFEANLALFLYLLAGLFTLLFFNQKKTKYLILSTILFILTLYTYNTYKLITPLTILTIFSLTYAKRPKMRKKLLIISLFSLLTMLPIILFSFGTNGQQRFLETSAFSEYPTHSLLQKLLNYPMIYLKNYLSYFSFPFLFATGDGFGRHTIKGIGPLFRWELPFLLIGMYYLIKNWKTAFSKTTIFLLLIAPTTAAFTRPSPHLLRSLLLVIPLTLITAYGLTIFLQKSKTWLKLTLPILCLIIIFEFTQYLHLYYTHYPLITALDWGAEYKQLITKATKQQPNFSTIIINTNVGGITEYLKFYNDKLPYQLVNNTWHKPKTLQNKSILYITGNDPQKNTYLQTIPHTHLQDIRFPNLNNDLFAQFWKI